MKKLRLYFTAFLILLVMSLTSLTVFADEMWSEEAERAYDTTATLSEEELQEIDRAARKFVSEYHYDLAVMTLSPESYDGGLEDEADSYYFFNDLGYGDDDSGIIFACNGENEELAFLKFGSAEEAVDDAFLENLRNTVPQIYETDQAYGVMRALVTAMQDYEAGKQGTKPENAAVNTAAAAETVTEAAAEAAKPAAALPKSPEEESLRECVKNSGIRRNGDKNAALPFWFPDSTENFPFYHDSAAPRVVDLAGIFTDGEKAEIKALIAEVSAEVKADLVIYTDTTDYGLGRNVCAADFYDFNGYGIGDAREGLCLMICMDPNNRGWYAAATGTETRELYTYSSSYALDDALYSYMSEGHYGEGVLDWIRNIRTFYKKGFPFAPEWWPDRTEVITAEAAAAAPRVVDRAGLFTAEQAEKLAGEVKQLSDQCGADVLINTVPDTYGQGRYDYAMMYYERFGYGLGEDHAGYCLTLYPGGEFNLLSVGEEPDRKMTTVNHDRIYDYIAAAIGENRFYEGAETWLKYLKHMVRTGRVMRPVWQWAVNAGIAAVLGFLISLIALMRAKKKMQTVKLATNADAAVSGKPVVRNINDIFVGSSTTRRTIARSESSGRSSSGSSDSSYSSSYTGSSGAEHSGSGRNF